MKFSTAAYMQQSCNSMKNKYFNVHVVRISAPSALPIVNFI